MNKEFLQEKRKLLKRALTKFETQLVNDIDRGITDNLFNLETKIHILKVYFDHLDCAIKDIDYLDRKQIELDVKEELLQELEIEDKLNIMCLVRGVCGV